MYDDNTLHQNFSRNFVKNFARLKMVLKTFFGIKSLLFLEKTCTLEYFISWSKVNHTIQDFQR